MNQRRDEQVSRVDQAEATIDRAEQVLSDLLAVAGELEVYVDRLLIRAGSPPVPDHPHPPLHRKKEDPPWRSR